MNSAEFQSWQYASPWSPLIVARFKGLWADEYSAANIIIILHTEFGHYFTRNAVIGKAHRLGLPARRIHPNNTDPIKLAERATRRRDYQRQWRASKYGDRKVAREMAPCIEDYAIPTPQRKTIFELGPHDCRWPVGEPQSDLFFFCGAIVEKDRPYCSGHCKRAFLETRSY